MIVGANRAARLVVASLVIALFAAFALYRALSEPSLGWRFTGAAQVTGSPVRAGLPVLEDVTALEAGGQKVALTPKLVIESAGIHNDYADHNAFFAEHARIWQLLQAPSVRIHHAAGVTESAPRPRSFGELGLRFWFPWLVALVSLSVGLAIWVYQPGGSATRSYLVASSGYAFGMLCTAAWGSRLVTQAPQGWAELHVASHVGSFMVTAGLCALLWLHPRRLGGNWLIWLLAGVVALSVGAETGQWLPTISLAFRLPIVLVGVLLGVIYALQWRACRADPGQRAQLKWFGLLLVMGLSSTFVAYAFGAAGRVVNIPQNYGLGTVALLFVGLVPLVTRIGLFRLEAWWPRAWLWFLGGLLVIALDLFLVAVLNIGADSAFAVSLALAGWLYFPLRQALWRRMSQGALPGTQDVLPQILELVTRGQGDRVDLNERWRSLWETVFRPQRLSRPAPGAADGIADEGRLLRVPATASLEALEMELPERGARLFNPADARRALEIANLVRHGLASGESFERGARQERQRIASDLHDDLGARLLTIAQASESPRLAQMARDALDEMRLAVRGLAGEAALAADVLADWRSEAVTRLNAAGLQPEWQADDPAEGLTLPARQHVQLTRILREAVSNVIRHSGAARCALRISFATGSVRLEIEDDGRGIVAVAPARAGGHGLSSIERRVRQLQGQHAFERGPLGGTLLRVEVPLGPQSANISRI